MRPAAVAAVLLSSLLPLHAQPHAKTCGELVTLRTHAATTTRYAIERPNSVRKQPPIALVLFSGGGGHIDLGDDGCPRRQTGNFLVRSRALFRELEFTAVPIGAPSDHHGEEGLETFRTSRRHAEDLGKAIVDLRKRLGQAVWLVGTSRGTISAANAAARLTGTAAPDGLVLTSAVTSAARRARERPWAMQTVFDLPLKSIRMPVLVVGHASDRCPRTPPSLMKRIIAQTNALREQAVTVAGGSEGGLRGLEACGPRTPHGFFGQEAEVVAGIARFVRGGSY
jgi:pimeloyl-ACP methyl ester carboxylesterase